MWNQKDVVFHYYSNDGWIVFDWIVRILHVVSMHKTCGKMAERGTWSKSVVRNVILASRKYECLILTFARMCNSKIPNVLNRSCIYTSAPQSSVSSVFGWRWYRRLANGVKLRMVRGGAPTVKRDGGCMDAEFWRRDVSGFSWVIGEFRQLT